MCGIAGILRFDGFPIDANRGERMMQSLRRRGPDGDGVWNGNAIALIHTRLSIIDLLGGQQPMSVPAEGSRGELTLVFNGEIYNHRELRRQLQAAGHRFVSDHCDTEVLLHGFRQWGTELPKHLHGMFAFAIWDAGERRLFLCRDRIGKKPLYLRWSGSTPLPPREGPGEGRAQSGSASPIATDDSAAEQIGLSTSQARPSPYPSLRGRGVQTPPELLFGSLVSTIVAGLSHHDRAAFDPQALLTYLRLGYTFEHSLVQGVRELPAAHWMLVDRDGGAEQQRYWRPPPISRSSTSMGAAESTRDLLEEAVSARLEADVPLVCFLSGGIDSSLVAAIAHKQLRSRGEAPLRTFSVSMPDIDYDEGPFARLVADHLKTQHTQLIAEPHDHLIDDLKLLVSQMGEPTADSSILPTFWLCRTAREHVSVALSGDGGDELFGGYDRYRAMRILAKHRRWLRMIPRAFLRSSDPRSKRHRLARLVDAARFSTESQRYRQMIHLFDEEQIRELARPFGPTPLPAPPAWSPRDTGLPLLLDDWPDEADPAHAAMRWDLTHYLPFDLLRKVDRASMTVALEVRCPLLDTQLLDLAGHLPTSVLMPGGQPKGLLRQVAAELLPAEIINRPKRGFAVPIGKWFRGPLRSALAEHIMEGNLDALYVNRYAAEQLLDEHTRGVADHTHRLFALLTLSIWAAWLK